MFNAIKLCYVMLNKSDSHLGLAALVNITFSGRKILMSTLLKSIITQVNVNAPVVATRSWWLHFSAPVVA